jgi:predicted aminopeptidase
VEFNEQLATFVGREGALLYLEQKYGDESAVFQEARERLQDQERFIELMQGLYRDLDEVYRSAVPEQEKLAAKKRIIKAFREDVLRNHDRYFDTGTYREFIAKEEINNALILLYMQYTNDLSRFERMYEKHGRDLPEMIQALVSQYGERNESSP